MNDMEPQHNLMPPGETDHEGAMAKADLFKLANYSVKLFKKIDDNDQLESWVQAKITKAADYIASVYHYLEYEMKFSEFGAKLENSGMYSESEKQELKNKLNEAREMLRTLKLAQAQKLEEAKSPKAKKDWDKDGKIESEKDEVIGSRRKAAGLDESHDDDDDDDDDSGYDRDDPKHPKWAERQLAKADLARKAKKEKDVNESWDDDDEDPDVKKADSELKKKGVKLPNVKHKEVPIKKTAKDKEEELDEGAEGPYQFSDPKHPKFKKNYEKFKKSNPDKKLADFVNAMREKDKRNDLSESWDDDEDPDVKKADSELKKRGVKLPNVKHKEVPVKKTAKDKEEELDESKGKKPDFLDLDKDGNKKEPMKKAAKEKKLDELSHSTLKSYADKKGDQMFKDKKPASGKDLTNYRKAIDKMHKKEDEGEVSESYKDRDMRKEPDLSPALRVHGSGHGAIDDDNKSRDYANSWMDDDDAVRGMKELEKVTKKAPKKESMNESADLVRMKEFLTRLNG